MKELDNIALFVRKKNIKRLKGSTRIMMIRMPTTIFKSVQERRHSLTFIMRTTVLIAIIVRMEYSNGVETTNFHILYWKDCLSWGM